MRPALLASVILVSGTAPLATDMYVPGFPAVAADLATGASAVQLTLTTFFVGMAVGQLVGGPVSDQLGRRTPLRVALVVLVVASLACAAAQSVVPLMAARFVQGLAGGWAMVIARTLVVDLNRGPGLVRALNVIAAIGGVTPVVGPLLGAGILQLAGWRATFVAVAALATVMAVASFVVVDETLPPQRRHGGGTAQLMRSTRDVLRCRTYVGYLLVVGLGMGITFAYVATSAFVLQSVNGLTPILYSVVFAGNAGGLMIGTVVSGRLAGRVPTRTVIAGGLVAILASGTLMLAGALWWRMPLWVALVGFFTLMTSQGFIGANAGALASNEVPEHAGTGSAVMGFLTWCMAGVVAPLAGFGGDRTAVPMAAIVLVLASMSLTSLLTLARSHGHPTDSH